MAAKRKIYGVFAIIRYVSSIVMFSLSWCVKYTVRASDGCEPQRDRDRWKYITTAISTEVEAQAAAAAAIAHCMI